MAIREVLEHYPLYRKYPGIPGETLDNLPKPAVHMPCLVCKSEQTFDMVNEYWDSDCNTNHFDAVWDTFVKCNYVCKGCHKFSRYFFLHFLSDGTGFMKIGQYPPWGIKPDARIGRALGEHSDFLKKGLICESQGYGIAAFAYYRRIVEEMIDQLLDEIPELMRGDDLIAYQHALEKTKQTIVAQEKIALVKDLLPPILRPDGMNPLGVLHAQLSQGLHARSDDECLATAMAVREIMVFLVNHLAISKDSAKTFTESMRALLSKKTEK